MDLNNNELALTEKRNQIWEKNQIHPRVVYHRVEQKIHLRVVHPRVGGPQSLK